MVGHLTLDQAVGVRVPAPQPHVAPYDERHVASSFLFNRSVAR
jgi:hypothetical protein